MKATKTILLCNFNSDSFFLGVQERLRRVLGNTHVVTAGYGWIGQTQLDIDFSILDNPRTLYEFDFDSVKHMDVFKVSTYETYYYDFFRILQRVTFGKRDVNVDTFYFYTLLKFWELSLRSHSVQFVVFNAAPHLPVEYCLYAVAKEHGIKILYPGKTYLGSSIVFYNAIGAKPILVGDSRKVEIVDYNLEELSNALPLLTERSLARKEKIKSFNLKSLLLSIVQLVTNAYEILLYPIKGVWKTHYFRLSRFSTVCLIMKNFSAKLLSKIYYNAHAVRLEDLPKKYIYFPLHYQPERSSIPEGLYYSDQLSAIASLADLLPEGFDVLVREHPKVFFGSSRNIRTMNFRSGNYYKVLRRIPRVKIVSMKVSADVLLEGSSLVASLTGTSMWEAILLRKPCLSFAPTWHSDFKYSPYALALADVRAYLDTAVNANADFDTELKKFLVDIGGKTFKIPISAKYSAHLSAVELAQSQDHFCEIIMSYFQP